MNNNQRTANEIVNFILKQKNSNLATLSMEGISETFDISRNELDSLTLEDNEMTIQNFLNRQKVFMAMEIIEKKPEMPACDLANLCGFSDLDTFTSEFSNYFLIEPKKCQNLKAYAPILKKIKDHLELTIQ